MSPAMLKVGICDSAIKSRFLTFYINQTILLTFITFVRIIIVLQQPMLFKMFSSSRGPKSQRQYPKWNKYLLYLEQTLNISSATSQWEGDDGSEKMPGEMRKH